jgi:hypothetical protein
MSDFNKLFQKMGGDRDATYKILGKNVPVEKLEGNSNFIQIDTTPKVVNIVDWSTAEVDTKYQQGVLSFAGIIDELDGTKLNTKKYLNKSSAPFTRKMVKLLQNKTLPIKVKVWKELDDKYNRYYAEEVQN